MATTSAQVQQLYVGLLGRAADQTGLNYWLNELNATPAKMTLENLRANIVNSQPEYKAVFGALSRVDTVTKIYNNLFGRAPDATGLTYWTTGAGATVNIDQLTSAFINGASAADTQALTNKTVVADVYTTTAGSAFVAADAALIISGVTNLPTSIGTALIKLTDGSLSGTAIPAAVAQIKAVESANAAVTAYQTAKVTDLNTINTNLVAAAKAIKADQSGASGVSIIDTTAQVTAVDKYAALTDVAGIPKEIIDARVQVGNGTAAGTASTTAAIQLVADTTAKALSDATAALKLADNGYLTAITNYQSAYTAKAATAAVDPTAATNAKILLATQLSVATEAQKLALVTALKATNAGFDAVDFADVTASGTAVAAIYTALEGAGTTAQVSGQIDTALAGFTNYASVKAIAAQSKDVAAKGAALTSAENALKAVSNTTAANDAEAAYLGAVAPADVAAKALANSKTIDAIKTAYDAVVAGNTAALAAQTKANGDLAAATNLVAINAPGTLDAEANASVNDVFWFGATGLTAAKDVTIENAGSVGTVKGVDSIYLGTDFVKGTGTVNTAGAITGGNDGVKEVFFFQKGNDTYVVAETKTFGSSTVTDYSSAVATATPDAAVIKLSGVGIEKVSFANGVVSVA